MANPMMNEEEGMEGQAGSYGTENRIGELINQMRDLCDQLEQAQNDEEAEEGHEEAMTEEATPEQKGKAKQMRGGGMPESLAKVMGR